VLVVGREKGPVRVRDLARQLSVSRPSVVAALGQLEERGLVRHEHYGGVELTAGGARLARAIYGRHMVLHRFLRDVLGVSDAVASTDACRLEHALSPETAGKLLDFVERRGARESGVR
jgi:DtxR family Mn-dependent transcriptional regulator